MKLFLVSRVTREYRHRAVESTWAVVAASDVEAIAIVRASGGTAATVLLPKETELTWRAEEADELIHIQSGAKART